MQLDVGEVRFLTKVATKSPRGLRLLLFKEKVSGKEKLVFVVKTASQDVDKLALSKMTWQVEQSKAAPRVVIVRLLILPEGSNEFFQSETGLIMNDDKDRKILDTLGNQKSIEIFFFNYESEFHSKIELLTTFNMAKAAQHLIEANPLVDEGKLIVKSENLSEADIKNAITGKIRDTNLKDKDLIDSIQKKMPVVSSSVPRTKPEEYTKTSIKSNEMSGAGNFGVSPTVPPEAAKKKELDFETLKNAISVPPGKISSQDLLNTIPINTGKSGLTTNDLKNAISVPPGKITSEELLNSIPPERVTSEDLLKSIPPDKFTFNDLMKSKAENAKSNDLLKVGDNVSSSKITPEDLLNSIPPNILTSEELLKSLNDISIPSESGLKAQDLLNSIGTSATKGGKLDKDNLFSTINQDKNSIFVDKSPTVIVDKSPTQELYKKDLLDALKSEPSPLKLSPEEENSLVNALKSEPTPLKSQTGELSSIMKDIESNIKSTNNLTGNNTSPPVNKKKTEEAKDISVDDLLKALNGES